jgi:FlaG/FlaF family flagellin (archaellin)
MMRGLLRSDKKGVSEMVAYVLLIILALGLSILVYSYLKGFIFKERVECPDGVSLSISEAECNCENNKLHITLTNNGRYTVYNSYVYLREFDGTEFKKTGIQIWPKSGESVQTNPLNILPGKPGEIVHGETVNAGKYLVEVRPVAVSLEDSSKAALCSKAVVTKEITLATDCNPAAAATC